jgi:hypothetical protein
MRRTKPPLWPLFAMVAVFDFFTLVIAGVISNTATGAVGNLVWYLWLLLAAASAVLLGWAVVRRHRSAALPAEVASEPDVRAEHG